MDTALSVVGFEVGDADVGGVEIDPIVDGVALGETLELDLVGILVGSAAEVAQVRADLLGGGSVWGRTRYALLQTCGCGIPEDDLLAAEVVADDATVTWRDFQRQTEPPPTYRAFGPYVFDRGAYEVAVDRACAEASARLDAR